MLNMKIEARQKLSGLIKDLRGNNSYRAYAKLLGVSGTTIMGWENMTSEPETGNLEHIAHLAGYSLQELLDYLNDRHDKSGIPVERIIRQVKQMEAKDLTVLNRAVADRFYAIAESVG
jgi:transcriptional regulator with XRE-family HTH domain